VYFGEFIKCTEPNVYQSTKKYSIKDDHLDNDLLNLFQMISFLDYSQPRQWPKALPAVTFSDITCHFGVEFGHATSDAFLYLPTTPIPLNGDCNSKFREMYKKKNGKDDETLSETRHLICPDTDKLPLVGDGTDCPGSGPCSYYTFSIFKHFGPTDHCNPINFDETIVSISYINTKLTVDTFHDPWSYEIDTEWSILSQKQTQFMSIDHFYNTLETDARRFGLKSNSHTDKKLMRNPVLRVDKSPYPRDGTIPYLVLV
jgi:hypothetical protein